MPCCNQTSQKLTIRGTLKGALAITKNALQIGLARSATINQRRAICHNCPNIVQGLVPVCCLCHCIIREKIQQSNSTCPDNPARWTAEPQSAKL